MIKLPRSIGAKRSRIIFLRDIDSTIRRVAGAGTAVPGTAMDDMDDVDTVDGVD